MNESKKVILFDFDGVLIDALSHAYDIHKAVNPHFTWEQYESLSDGNFHEEYQKMTTHAQPENFFAQYSEKLKTVSVEDQMALLIKFLSKKYILHIISSTHSDVIAGLLDKENITTYFKSILGYETHSSKVVKIQSVLDSEKVELGDCIFITDTIGDIKEARTCGVESIGVTWGLHKKEKLEKENPYAVVDTPEELDMAIMKFFSIL